MADTGALNSPTLLLLLTPSDLFAETNVAPGRDDVTNQSPYVTRRHGQGLRYHRRQLFRSQEA